MIGSGDLEHYYSGLVLKTAQLMSGADWERMSCSARRRWLNKAIRLLTGLVNDIDSCIQLERLFDAPRRKPNISPER